MTIQSSSLSAQAGRRVAGGVALMLALTTGAGSATPAQAGVQPTPFLDFRVLEPSASGPPYPTAPVLVDVRYPPDPVIGLEILGLLLKSVNPVLPIGLGGATGRSGRQVTIDFVLGNPPDDGFPAASFFDVFFEVRQHPGSRAAPVLGVEPTPFLPGPASFFDVFFDVTLDGIGTLAHAAHFETRQPLAFSGVQVTGPQSPAFGVSYSLERTGAPLDAQAPLFTVTIEGSVVPEPGTLALFGIGLGGILVGCRRPGRRARRNESSCATAN